MLTCEHLTKKYMTTDALTDVSLSLEKGKIYALLGPNGSGKTTYMKIAAGLIKPTSGTIGYENKPIGPFSKSHISFMPTEPYFYSYMTILDIGKYYSDFYPDFDLDRFQNFLSIMELNPHMKINHLSTGLTAKLKLAASISRKASLYLLDEPLNGIDIITRDQIISAILETASDQNTIVISSHLVEELEKVVDYVIFMKKGQIAQMGNAEELREKNGQSIVDLYKNIYSHGGSDLC